MSKVKKCAKCKKQTSVLVNFPAVAKPDRICVPCARERLHVEVVDDL